MFPRFHGAPPRALIRVLALVGGVVALSAPGAAQAAAPGVAPDITWATSPADQDRAIAALDDMGAEWVRLTLEWRTYEPADNRYDAWWQAHVDRAVDLAHRRGMKIIISPTQSPQWASGSTNIQAPPRDPAAFADFMRYVAARYAGRVQVWEIWNEPNIARFWPTGPDPRAYAALLRAAYPAVKEGDPGARVMFGGVAAANQGSRQYVLDALAAGARGAFDIMGWHPYTYAGRSPDHVARDSAGRITADSFTGYREVRADLLAQGLDVPIWLTEFGWTTSSQTIDTSDWEPWTTGVSEATQAEYVTRSFEILRADPYVEVAVLYNLRNNYWSHDADDVESRFGLMRTDWTPKPAYHAFKALATAGETAPVPDATPVPTPEPTPVPAPAPVNQAPTVRLTAPTAGATFHDRLVLAANASDDARVARVEFRVGPTLVTTDSTAPYAYTWKVPRKLAYGTHRVSARAHDAEGAVAEFSVTVTRGKTAGGTLATTGSATGSRRARCARTGRTAARRTQATASAKRGSRRNRRCLNWM